MEPQSTATSKHKFTRLHFNPANQRLFDFLDKLQNLAKDALRVAARAVIEKLIYVKMRHRLNKKINHAHTEKDPNDRIVSYLSQRELELKGREPPGELQIDTMRQQATKKIRKNSNQLATTAKS